jgi:glycosyltransferase involved in cell wall biosynthesis
MKILVVHNTYQERGGEDAVVATEEQILAEDGHTVVRYRRGNDELKIAHPLRIALAGIETVWSSASNRELYRLIFLERPDVAHFHNTFPLISPAAYYACQDAGVPVVQTLHNYRLLCPAATFFRDGRVCESCMGRNVPWPGVVHGCYRDSRSATSAVSGMLTVHRALQTWNKKVDVYIALSEFARQKFIEGGLPPERIVVKQNFVHRAPEPKNGEGQYALCVGRLSEEKGIRVLLSAWSKLAASVPLRIAGDGPLHEEGVSEITRRRLKQVDFLGRLPVEDIFRWMRGARFLVFPSVCFENFPLAIAEAFACGLPVIASRLGAMAEIVADGKTGLHFTAGDDSDLAVKVDWAWMHPEEMRAMGQAARAEYEAKYTAEHNYQQLMSIYGRAIAERQKSGNLLRTARTPAS